MLINFNYPKLAKEKFDIVLNDQLPMRERYDALKFVKLYVDRMNLDFFNFFLQLKKDQKNAGQHWFYDGHQLTIKNYRGHRGADGILKRDVSRPPDQEEDSPEAATGTTPDQEYVPDPDYDNRFD
jgi:hypothetical protein